MKEINKQTLELFSAYFDETISQNQYVELCNWLEEAPENKNLLSEYLNFYKKSRQIGLAKSVDKEKAWNIVLERINQPIKLNPESNSSIKNISYLKPIFRVFRYAAAIAVIIGVTYIFRTPNDTINAKVGQLIISNEAITLELENGNIKVINSDGIENIVDKSGKIVGTQRDNMLAYDNENNSEELIYNKLSVPNGKKFMIVLSDGTKVHLNAGTSIKYPVKFLKGQNRHVYLLSGEAYFDVAKDANHPFIVNSHDMNVRVLGTKFNLSSYPEDTEINTVLVEGAVSLYGKGEVYNKEKASILDPGFKASWNISNQNINIHKVDTSIYTGWVDGKLIFKKMAFKKIIKKLERRYNVTIVNNNVALEEEYYDATFDIETIEQVLNSFNESYEIQYSIENNEIIIN